MQSEPSLAESPSANPAEPFEVIRLGKDEMNLAEFPITLLTDRVPKDKRTVQFQDSVYDEKSGKRITRKLTISADETHGLPTAVDDDVILGLIQLTKQVNDFTSREVAFSRLDLIRLMGWPDSGDSYRRLTTSLKRWLSVTLLYENAWRDNRKQAWTTKGFHILDNIELNDTRSTGSQGELFPSKITWNKVVFESFAAGFLKSIDYGLYLKLKLTVARRMYRFLSKRMYFGPDMSFELRDFAFAHIGLSDTYSGNAAKIKEKLQPAIEELESVGFLEHMAKEDRYQKEGKAWRIRLVAKVNHPALPAVEAPPAADDGLVAELVKRGVIRVKAIELVERRDAAYVGRKIEVFDWMIEKKDKRLAKNPPGFLLKSITDDYADPKGFASKAEQQRQEDGRRAKEKQADEDRRRVREAEALEARCRKQADDYWNSLAPDQQAAMDAEIDAAVDAETLAVENNSLDTLKRISRLLRRRNHIMRLLGIDNA